MGFWTPDKVERLKVEWAAGTSVRVIADLLGGSRNTIIGKAHRLDLPIHADSLFHPERLRKKSPPKIKPKRAGRRAVRIKTVRRNGISAPHAVLAAMPPPFSAPEPLNIALADLEPCHCRYAVSTDAPFVFCGHQRKQDSAWCSFHHALCHEKRREKQSEEDRRKFIRAYARAA